jgi:steroid delta-isomerase-like uncharacterized protein
MLAAGSLESEPVDEDEEGGHMSPEAVVNQVIEAFNRHDAEAVGTCYAEDAVVHDPASPEPLKGRDAIIAFDHVIFGAFPDVRWEPLAPVIVSGNQAVWQIVTSATFDGPMPMPDGTMVEPNGERISLEQAVISTIDDGLIVEERAYFDATGFAMELGLVG